LMERGVGGGGERRAERWGPRERRLVQGAIEESNVS